jgi:hypothetical protein
MNRFLLLLALSFPTLIFAAAQYPEKLRIDGKEEHLMATPLENFWGAEHPRPNTLTQTSWACWRGYVGTWEIIDNKLCLLQLARHEIRPKEDTFVEESIDLPLQPVFGTPGPVLAEWFSGVLRVARGQVLVQVNTGYASVYEEDLFLTVDHGNITSRRTVTNTAASITSESDLAWREFGRIDANGGVTAVLPESNLELEKGRWLGGRELAERADALAKNNASFEVRGIYFPGKLWFPNQLGEKATYPLDAPDLETLPSTGVAVEATCTLVATDKGLRLLATEINELPRGFAIQRQPPTSLKPNLIESTKLAADSSAAAEDTPLTGAP